jgi:hypothetical protein
MEPSEPSQIDAFLQRVAQRAAKRERAQPRVDRLGGQVRQHAFVRARFEQLGARRRRELRAVLQRQRVQLRRLAMSGRPCPPRAARGARLHDVVDEARRLGMVNEMRQRCRPGASRIARNIPRVQLRGGVADNSCSTLRRASSCR